VIKERLLKWALVGAVFCGLGVGVAMDGDAARVLAQPTCVVQNTPFISYAYGSINVNGLSAPAGTLVEAKSPRGDTVGCAEVTVAGSYGAMPIYGEDTSVSPTIAGMRSGETVDFFINGVRANNIPVLLWSGDKDIHQTDLTLLPQGDVSCDGMRNVIDALFILQKEVGMRHATNSCIVPMPADSLYTAFCDVSNDSLCNVVDALFILQCEVGISNVLCPASTP